MTSQKFILLEAMRGLASVYVLLHHIVDKSWSPFGLPLGQCFRFGQEAVIIFFILSGFVIQYSSQRKKDLTFGAYFKARFFRIYCIFIPALFISYLTACIGSESLENIQAGKLIGNVLMLQDVSALKPGVLIDTYKGNAPLWSLAYEWWFYMLFWPFRNILAKHTGASILTFSLAATAYLFFPHFSLRIVSYMAIWWSGSLIAIGMQENNSIFKTYWKAFLTVLAPSLILTFGTLAMKGPDVLKGGLGVHPILEIRHFWSACLILLIAFIWQALRISAPVKLIKPFILIAPISYALYIVHYPILNNTPLGNSTLGMVVAIALSLILSYGLEVILWGRLKGLMSNRQRA